MISLNKQTQEDIFSQPIFKVKHLLQLGRVTCLLRESFPRLVASCPCVVWIHNTVVASVYEADSDTDSVIDLTPSVNTAVINVSIPRKSARCRGPHQHGFPSSSVIEGLLET